jgi:hypothetical protein
MFLKHGAHEFRLTPLADDAEFQSARTAAEDAEASTDEAERRLREASAPAAERTAWKRPTRTNARV